MIESKSDKRCGQGINQEIDRSDAGAIAVRPAKIFQQGQIVDAESAVDAAHHHHIDEAERQDDVAVEESWTHGRITLVSMYVRAASLDHTT